MTELIVIEFEQLLKNDRLLCPLRYQQVNNAVAENYSHTVRARKF